MSSHRLATALLLGVVLTAGAEGELRVAERFASGDWRGGAYVDDETGLLSHCAVHAGYGDGQVLILLRSENGFSVALADPRWHLGEGERYEFVMGVDTRWTRRVSGYVPNSHAVRVDLGNDPSAVDAFRRGDVLTVLAEQEALRFALSGSARAIDALERCYARHIVRSARNPFAGSRPADEARVSTPKPAHQAGRLPQAHLSLQDFTALLRAAAEGEGAGGVAEGALSFAHYYYLVGGRTLSLYWEEESGQTDPEVVLERHMTDLQGECKGRVSSGELARDTRGEALLRHGFVSCSDPADPLYVSVAVIQVGPVTQVLATFVVEDEVSSANTLGRRFYELEVGVGERSARL